MKNNNDLKKYSGLIRKVLLKDYNLMFREKGGVMKYPFLTPGSKQYDDVLWDWDSWLSNVALRQILKEVNSKAAYKKAQKYERGCVLNFLEWGGGDGYVPIVVPREGYKRPQNVFKENMHKPCLAQHAAFLTKEDGGDAKWLRDLFYNLQAFVNKYRNHHRHEGTGLYYWESDICIGVDNDPCTFGRPDASSGSIYLNCLMVKELEAMVYLSEKLNLKETAVHYTKDLEDLKNAIQKHCWDEWLGFFYSVDLELPPVSKIPKGGFDFVLHTGMPRDWKCLIQRIGVWSGFLAMWSGTATKEQAARMVNEHYSDENTFNAPYGIRTLSKMEKMYCVKASGNPSSWLGPVWGISNYLVWRGLLNYGYEKEARELAGKTIKLFGRDLERFGALHEYYEPENGEPVLNKGFQNWNYLVLNMLNWYEGKKWVSEF